MTASVIPYIAAQATEGCHGRIPDFFPKEALAPERTRPAEIGKWEEHTSLKVTGKVLFVDAFGEEREIPFEGFTYILFGGSFMNTFYGIGREWERQQKEEEDRKAREAAAHARKLAAKDASKA